MIDTSCDKRAWFRASCHNSDVQNHTASDKIGWETTFDIMDGYTLDVLLLTEFKFLDEIYYYEDENENMKEAHGKCLGHAKTYGDYM